MPTFAGFWKGADIDDREDLGVLDKKTAADERVRRRELVAKIEAHLRQLGFLKKEERDPQAVLRACLNFLATGPGRVALANVEDFWLEPKPQNVPGTWRERPNWTRRAKYALEEFTKLPAVLQALREMDQAVKQGR
jgi:4-alpha-glucanotransferase